MELKARVRLLPPEEQERFFRKAAKFFSNRELTAIIGNISSGCSLYQAHEQVGIFDRYNVDLKKLI